MLSRITHALALAVVLLGLSVPVANATGTGQPVITSPADGSTVPSGWTGPVTVDFSDAVAADYDFEIDCDSGYSQETTWTYDGSQDVMSWTVPEMTGSDSCQLVVEDMETWGSEGFAQSTFNVASPPPPPLVLDRVSQSPATFYPLVRDGYRDATRTHFHINVRADVTISVMNNSGATVRRAQLGTLRSGGHAWTWNGRKNNGRTAVTGRYHLLVTAAAAQTRTAKTAVVVASGWVTRHGTSSRAGSNYSSARTSGACQISAGWDDASEELDCWGGHYATTKYRFGVPAHASNVKWHVSGGPASDDICCTGSIKKTGTWVGPSHRQVLIQVKVTGWRAYDVDRAYITYTYQRRI